jgi:small subunit ribosomal protein S5
MAFSLPLSQVIGAGVSSTVGFSSTPISSCRTSAEAAASSPAALCFSSSLWGSKIRFSRGGAPASTSVSKAGISSLSLSPQALLLDDEEEETEEEITAAYEALYGKAFSGLASSKSDSRGMDDGDKGRRDRGPKEFEERVVQIRRVTKVVKGGKQLSFRAVVVLGDKKGRVGVGVAKAKEVIIAVQKAGTDARRHIITVPMTKYLTFPHRADGQYGAAKVMLRPAATGTGVIAGGSVRVVLELAGVENALGKEIGSKNPLNNARAVVEAVTQMKQFRDVAADRGIPMEELWK